jgi:hypothetical protein
MTEGRREGGERGGRREGGRRGRRKILLQGEVKELRPWRARVLSTNNTSPFCHLNTTPSSFIMSAIISDQTVEGEMLAIDQ